MRNIGEYLKYHSGESKIFMPNEIYNDIQDERIKKGHRPFAYSYYYLINYLYRNAKYQNINTNITTKDYLDILGFSQDNRRLSYIMKENGVLEQMNYIETTKEIPTVASNCTNIFGEREGLEFDYYQYDERMADYVWVFPNNYKIKKPVLAFHRQINCEDMVDDYKNGYIDGTFYEVENTHLIPFEVFLFCMEHKDIECDGFYLYSYLKMKNDHFPDTGYKVSLTQLCNDLGFSRGNLVNKLNSLKRYNMIKVVHNQEFFAIGLKEEERKPNSYFTKEWSEFDIGGNTTFSKIKYINREEYKKILDKEKKEEEEKNNKKKAHVKLADLPY